MDPRFAKAQNWDKGEDNGQASEQESGLDSEGSGRGETGSEDGDEVRGSTLKGNTKGKKASSVLLKDAKKYKENIDKRGVIYMSRIPPFMKPNKARTLLEPYGEITRIYLAEEDASVRKKRKEGGGNSSRQFAEGWVEFADKKLAKRVAESLNNTPIGGRKGDFYRDDTWNLKYLKQFKWEYLTEKVAYERRVREQKVKASMMQAKRENAEFVELVEQNKAHKHIEERKKKRQVDKEEEGTGAIKKVRSFRQDKLLGARNGEGAKGKVGEGVIGKIFSKKK